MRGIVQSLLSFEEICIPYTTTTTATATATTATTTIHYCTSTSYPTRASHLVRQRRKRLLPCSGCSQGVIDQVISHITLPSAMSEYIIATVGALLVVEVYSGCLCGGRYFVRCSGESRPRNSFPFS